MSDSRLCPSQLLRECRVRKFLIAGLVALLPALVTLYILAWAFGPIHTVVGGAIHEVIKGSLGVLPPGMEPGIVYRFLSSRILADVLAMAAVVAGIFVVGAMLGTLIGQRYFHAVEGHLVRIPVVRSIYPMIREVTDLFTAPDGRRFGQVVAVEFPKKGCFSVGFITNQGIDEMRSADGRKMICVFLPNAPTPMAGFVAFFPADELIPLKMTADEAFKFIVSAGVIVPPDKTVHKARPADVSQVPVLQGNAQLEFQGQEEK